jgi:hypothetical protein
MMTARERKPLRGACLGGHWELTRLAARIDPRIQKKEKQNGSAQFFVVVLGSAFINYSAFVL